MTSQDPQGRRRSDGRTPPELITSAVGNLQTLARQEVALLKAQVADAGAHYGKAGGAGAAAAILMLFVLAFLGVAGGTALKLVLQPWAAWLVVAGVFLVLAAVAGQVAKSQAERGAEAPKIATNKIKEDVEWAKQQIKR